ncbi:hypothetical protein ACWE42_04340, partial [Sutcliffiella cohnii]
MEIRLFYFFVGSRRAVSTCSSTECTSFLSPDSVLFITHGPFFINNFDFFISAATLFINDSGLFINAHHLFIT